MKKIILLIFLIFVFAKNNMQAQDPEGVYFIFTSVNDSNRVPGKVYRYIFSPEKKLEKYKENPLIFWFHFNNNWTSSFWHYERVKPKVGDTTVKEKDKHKVYIRDEAFLDSVQCYDWDGIKRMERFPWRDFQKKICYKNIYVIDRNDTKDGKIKIYQVKMY